MTVSVLASQVSYAGNGATTAFPTTFKFLENSHITVEQSTSGGAYLALTEGVGYTLTGAGVDAGGTVTMAVAPPGTDTVRITRDTPITQELDLPPQGAFLPAAHEEEFDKGALIDQELDRRVAALEAGAVEVVLSTSIVYATLTPTDPLEGNFPFTVPCFSTPDGVKLVRVENLTTPSKVRYDGAFDWGTPAANQFTVKYIGGLDIGDQYQFTFEVSGS